MLLYTGILLGEDALFYKKRRSLALASVPLFAKKYESAALSFFARYAEARQTAEARNQYAMRLSNAGLYARARREYERALAIKPRMDNLNFNMGSNYEKEKNYSMALRYYLAEWKTDPADKDVAFRLGRVYVKMKRYKKALPYLRRALKIRRDAETREYLRKARRGLGKKR